MTAESDKASNEQVPLRPYGPDPSNPLSLSIHELNSRPGPPEILPPGEVWESRRASIASVWRDFMGVVDEAGSGAITVVSQRDEEGEPFSRWSITLDGGAVGAVPAELLVPHGATAHNDAAPAVIACHTTNSDGKLAVTTSVGKRRWPYGLELARRGYVVLAPDCLTAGERIYPGHECYDTSPFYREHPDSSMVARNLADHRSALNALCSLPFVDAERIGAIGHSLGGYNSYFLAGLDERVKAVVSSCGFSPFRHDPRPTHWGRRDWYTHLPRVTEEFARFRVPFDFGQIVALVAPRPIFHYFGQMDSIFPHWQSIAEALQSVRQLYVDLGHEESFEMIMEGGPHAFPDHIRELSYQFLDRWLAPNEGAAEAASGQTPRPSSPGGVE